MATTSFSIYVRPRPLRTAFLVSPEPASLQIVDALIAANGELWGGRYNPLCFSDGNSIEPACWRVLEAIDPDIVVAFPKLSRGLASDIAKRLHPLWLRQHSLPATERRSFLIEADTKSLSLLPTEAVLRAASYTKMPCPLLLVDSSDECDEWTRRFVAYNFGTYRQPIERLERALDSLQVERHIVATPADLQSLLTAVARYRSVVYQARLSTVPADALPGAGYQRSHDAVEVVIGDSCRDIAHYWNLPAFTAPWRRTIPTQVWLPTQIATQPSLAPLLGRWLKVLADQIPGGNAAVEFSSRSLPQDDLGRIAENLTKESRVWWSVKDGHQWKPPRFEARSTDRAVGEMSFHRASSSNELVNLEEPSVVPIHYADEHWMADVYIERPMPSDRYSWQERLWWQCPRANAVPNYLFRRPARILASRFPSALMKKGSRRLVVRIPSDRDLMRELFRTRWQGNNDARDGDEAGAGYLQVGVSDKGSYLAGWINILGGLDQAYRVLSQAFWRNILDEMAGQKGRKDEAHRARAREVVGKMLRRASGAAGGASAQVDWLAEQVLELAKGIPSSGREWVFADFMDRWAAATSQDRGATRGFPFNELRRLTDLGVIMTGVRPKCQVCGTRYWYSLDDVKRPMTCRGCDGEFYLPPETHWSYRINSLAGAAHAEHGLVPLALVLGQLLLDARTSFVWWPCVELRDRGEAAGPGDVDIAAIVDGMLVIGEVKRSVSTFPN